MKKEDNKGKVTNERSIQSFEDRNLKLKTTDDSVQNINNRNTVFS